MAAVMAPTPAWLDCGVAGRPLDGEACSGDLHLIVPHSRGVLIGLIDGLGHGPEAAAAARVAAIVCEQHGYEALPGLMQLCHDALHRTRGAVLTLVSFHPDGTIDWLGVGNVDGTLILGPRDDGLSTPGLTAGHGKVAYEYLRLHGGIVGYQMPRLRPSTLKLIRNDLVILTTDGIRSGFVRELPTTLRCQQMAERILEEYGRPTDDALALAVRYVGGA